MKYSDIRQARHLKYSLDHRVDIYQRQNVEFPAKAGNIFTGVLTVPGKKYTIWVTLDGSNQVVEAINGRVVANVGTRIIVGYEASDQTKTMRVLRQSFIYAIETPGDGIPYHAAQHEWFGGDDVFISSGQFLPGMIVPVVGTLTVQIYPRQYRKAAGWYFPPAYVTVDLTSHVAATTGKARWSLIVVDSTGAFDVRDGSEITGFDSLTDADKPEPAAGDTPLWFVKSFAGITQFIHNPDLDYFQDARWTSGGGGSSAITIEEVDGTPSGLITKIIVPNTSLSITGGVATFAPPGSGDVVGPATSTDGHLAVWDGTDSKTLKDGGAPGASVNPLLAYNSYSGGNCSLTSTSYTDVDATNMVVTFTAPASGNVMIDLIATAHAGHATTGNYSAWGLRESTTDLIGDVAVRAPNNTTDAQTGVIKTFVLTGISAGSHTYKWSYLQSAGTGVIYANSGSPAVMRVWALP